MSAHSFVQFCLAGHWQPAAVEAARALARDGLNWDAVRAVADESKVEPLLHRAVQEHDLVPEPVAAEWQQAYFHTGIVNAYFLSETRDLLARFAAEGVETLLLKGAALAETVYPSPALRPMDDVDLLVRPSQAEAALRVAASLGYVLDYVEARPGAAVTHENEAGLHRPGHAAARLDIHWALIDSPFYQQRLPADWFWESAEQSRRGPVTVRVLGPGAQVLYLCAHFMLHHGGAGLLWLHDVAETLMRRAGELDWAELCEHAREYELVLPLRRVVLRLADGWRLPLPAAGVERVRALEASPDEARVFGWLTAPERPVPQRFWADLASQPGWGRRLAYAWIHIVPSPAYMRDRYHIRHPALLPLFYPYRWFTGLRSALVTWAGGRRKSPQMNTDGDR